MELAFSAVQTVFAALQCSQLRNLLSVSGYKSELESLDSTVDNVGDLGLDLLVRELREKLKRKYLLVLDDLWTENHGDWLKLKGYLVGLGERGNKIVVTTRSNGTTIAVGSNNPYMLKALSHKNSWNLFERVVGKEQANHNDLVEIGKNIIKKCANVPLAIKVMGTLLHGQPVDKWQSIQRSRLAEIKNDGNDIIPILKFSYYHLLPSLKSCFTYCAMFPKDFRIQKEQLISLWMAHGYVEPLDGGQIIEEAAEEHFQILARRCFFQEFERSGMEETLTFKVHDLMHDVAQQASGKDIVISDSTTMDLDKKTRHVYDSAPYDRTIGFITATTAKIRSYAQSGGHFGDVQFPVRALLENWRSVRVLDLSRLNITDLPNAIGDLLHLRWLNLDGNAKLNELPESLTKLINLQTLFVRGCYKLEEFPEDFSKLINLRTLYVPYEGNYGLRCMPLGMEKMACLTRLNKFVLGHRKSTMKGEVRLEDLRLPRNLRGSLKILIRPYYKHSKEYGGGGGYLCNTKYLKSVSIECPWKAYGRERMGDDEDDNVLEDLQPHSNLKELAIKHYPRLTIPQWAREDGLATSLPNLVKIRLDLCFGLKELPWLGKLQHLKTLKLYALMNLEYMESKARDTNIDGSSDGAATSSMAVEIFFPSLENLELIQLQKLKGWWRGQRLPLFPRLSQVRIEECRNLRSIPVGPAVETLILMYSGIMGGTSSNDCGNSGSDNPKIKEIRTSNLRFLKSLPMVAFQGLTKMMIFSDYYVQSLLEVEEVFRGCSSSLQFLQVDACFELRCVSRGLQHLTALESLELVCLPRVVELPKGMRYLTALQSLKIDGLAGLEDLPEWMPWRCLAQCLRSLELCYLPKVVELPRGMRHLTALQSLKIVRLPGLKEVPQSIACLPSLHSLEIWDCEDFKSVPEALGSLTSLKIY
ncbi:hypothetical protein Cgig2_020696 [Carnegiea gigantea]|uniref:NB-ARC domain-containing protein n=1 Tax=Carnegiea gigantea TaxID=171969 RepID=A0A9Q1GH96_9CARY|nr:hypothetical protein Cgig2_020696 [Carnegiea gigantea]